MGIGSLSLDWATMWTASRSTNGHPAREARYNTDRYRPEGRRRTTIMPGGAASSTGSASNSFATGERVSVDPQLVDELLLGEVEVVE